MSQPAREWLEADQDAAGLPSALWAVLWRLAWFYNEDKGGAWPSVPLLRRCTHLSESTIYRTLSTLEKDGWIDRDSSRGKSTFYSLPRYKAEQQAGGGVGQGSRPARGPSQGGRSPSRGATGPSQGATLEIRETPRDEKRHRKPEGAAVTSLRSHGWATVRQLSFLRDIYIMETGYVPSQEESDRDRAVSAEEADELIRSGWARLEEESAARILNRLPRPRIVELSLEAQRWLSGGTQVRMAA